MARAPEHLRVSHISHHYPAAAHAALSDVSFDVAPGRTLAIVGPSGAGKSTLLRMLAGLCSPASGEIFFGLREARTLCAQERRAALVFQTDALFAHMTVRANLTFALRERSRLDRVEALAATFDISRHLDRMPSRLSGGERQRVSIVRAMLSDPGVLLLDEPLGHLDPELRALVREELAGVRARFDGPILYVTHDHSEALVIADELLVLMDGCVEDAGNPQRVYDAPRTVRTARFLGERPMNLFDRSGDDAVTGIRAEHIRVDPRGSLPGAVFRRELTGPDAYLSVLTQWGPLVLAFARMMSSDPATTFISRSTSGMSGASTEDRV
ncbi:MAG: ABC transporter ATP-binding protein [Candidatus Eremiobacteraeota bacterium]|nr:ABC transporter ATP-binding protein [Candidatus Eremiobacteraeota bacterium]